MAITATSLLQSKKLSIIKITPKFFNQVGSIKTTVISIKNIIVDKKLLIQPRPKKDLQLSSSKFFGLRRTSPIRLPSIIPNLGIEETLKRFILFTFFGNVFPKLIQFLPKLKGVVDGISGATKFVYEFTGNFFKGVVDAIDIGYKAATETKKFLNKITGSKFKDSFDKFEDGLKTFINGAIIAGGLIGASGLPMPKLFKPKFNMGASIKGAYGKSAFNDYKDLMKSGKTQSEALKEIQKNYTKRVGFAAPISKILKKSPIGRATRFAKRVPIIGKVFSRVPIIGALIDFVISIISGESVGRAAARAVGASVGAALGTLIPIPIAGTILGGVLGDVVGGALYDTLASNFNKPKKYKSGGLIKRNGKIINAPIRRSKPKAPAQKLQTRRYNPPKTYAGKDIGGEKKLSELFNDQKDPTVRSPLRSLKTTSQLLKTIPLFGGLMGASVDIAMGQKPDPNIYINFINNFNALIQNNSNKEVNTSLSEVNSSIMRMASGGVIPRTMAVTPRVDSERLGQVISTTFATMLNQRTNQIFQQIIKEISLKSPLMNPSGDYGPGGEGAGGYSPPEGIEKDIYDYLISKGLSDNHALGIMANIFRESKFKIAEINDIGAAGLFQWLNTTSPRRSRMEAAVPDWKKNWRGQIDYA
ncbi:MAG: hypothetical protein EBS19_08900, partial [Spirochaetia bacterium]|nr:hypothetical protein [Spirochaetia bacterium]